MTLGSAEKENERYINSIEGKLARLKNTFSNLSNTLFKSEGIKIAVDALNGVLTVITQIISALDRCHMLIPAIVGGFAGFKAVTSIFKEINAAAAGIDVVQKLTAGEKLTAFAANVSGKFTALKGSITGAWAALQAFTGLSTVGLVASLGAVAVAIAGVYAVTTYLNKKNEEGIKHYNNLTKSIKEHQKALEESKKKEENLTSLYDRYQQLSQVTNKTKEQQEEYNQVLQKLAKIDPDLVLYDENGSPIKVREGEVKDLISELQRAQREQKALMQGDLREKADTSYNNYQNKSTKRDLDSANLKKYKQNLLEVYNAQLGFSRNNDWFKKVLDGDKEWATSAEEYFKRIKKVKEEESKVINSNANDLKRVSKDRSDYLKTVFDSKDVEKYSKQQKKAMESALKLDFSQFTNEQMDSINMKIPEVITGLDKKQVKDFNGYINQVNNLNDAWRNGETTSKSYADGVNAIAKKMSDLTGGKISTEEFAKMLKIPEFDATEANRVFSDLDNAQNTLREKLYNMSQIESPRQKLQLAYDIIQDERVPEEIREKVAEFASDGSITDQELEILMDLVGKINEGDLENTVNEELDKLSEEKEVTTEVAINYATKVENGADFDQYIRELTGDATLAMDIQVDMNTSDLETLKADLKDLPPEKQIGIIVAAAASGQYTPEQIQSFIETLPPEVQTAIKANDQASNIINNVKNNVNNVPKEKNTNLNASDNASGKANTVTNSVKNIPQSHNTTIKAEDSASGVIGRVKDLIAAIPAMKTVKIVAQKVGDFVGGLFGGGGKSTKSVGDFSNVSDTPTESGDVSAMGTFSNVSSTPTESGGTSATGEGAPSAGGQSSGQVSSRAIGDIDLTDPGTSTINTSSLSKVWDAIKRGIDLFKELNQRIDKVKGNLGILGEKLDMAVGKERVKLLKQQNTLYSQQASLTKTLYNKLNESQSQMTKQVKKYGFTIKNGFLDNYEETLSKLEKASEDAQKKLDDYNDKKSSKSSTKTSSSKKKTSKKKSTTSKKKTTSSKKTSSSSSSKTDTQQKALEKAAEKAKEKLEEAKNASDAFLNQDKEIQDCQQEWQKL